MLVFVAHDETNGAACRLAFEDTAQQLNPVGLLTRGRNLALPGTTPVQLLLYEVEVNVNTSRHAVNNASYRCTVALAKRGERKLVTECITHGSVRSLLVRDVRLRSLLGVRLRSLRHSLRLHHSHHSLRNLPSCA